MFIPKKNARDKKHEIIVTKHITTKHKPKELIEYLETVIANIPGNIFWKDREGIYLGCNDNLAKILKLKSRKNIIGKTNYDLLPQPYAQETTQADEQTMSSGKELVVEETGLDANDKVVIYLTRKEPIFDKRHQVIGLLGTSFDITEYKQAQAKIIQLEKEKAIIEAKQRTITELSASIAHEVGNLLAGIIVNMQLLDKNLRPEIRQLAEQQDHEKYSEILHLLDSIEKNIKNTKFMFESIKFNIQGGKIDTSQFELSSIHNDIEAVLANCFPGEEIVAKIKWNKDINFEYLGIPSYTRNILINLIKNAIHFIKEQKQGTITITLKKGEKFNQLIFEDTALGIAKKLLPKLFTPSLTTRKGGMGMGLVFCKRIMQSYGGDIICQSKLHQYTRFILTFPTLIIE